jgi:hypothetical protein
VSVTVSPAFGTPPPTPTGTVTVSDSGKTICTITLSGGSGSCTGTPSILIGGLAAVGTRTITATYGGDFTFNGSSGSKNQQVIFKFTGFFSPLKTAGICPSSSSSGIQKRGSGVPFKWRLQDANNNLITSLNTIDIIEDFSGSGCGAPGTGVVLYSPATGLKGGSTLKYDTGSGQFHFVWDTGYQTATGIHTVVIRLVDGRSYATTINLK